MSILLDGSTRVLVQGATGGEARRLIPTMTAYGTNIVAGGSPGKGGERGEGIPVYSTVAEALKAHAGDLSLLFIPARFTKAAALEAIAAGVPAVHILAEGVPHHDASEILTRAKGVGAFVIGPNSQGMVSPGKAKVGGTGGEVPHLMFRPGPVGGVSPSRGVGARGWLRGAGVDMVSMNSPGIMATRGLVKPPPLMKSAASSSRPVPGSPNMTTHFVSGSFSNSASISTKAAPIKRSPPMAT